MGAVARMGVSDCELCFMGADDVLRCMLTFSSTVTRLVNKVSGRMVPCNRQGACLKLVPVTAVLLLLHLGEELRQNLFVKV